MSKKKQNPIKEALNLHNIEVFEKEQELIRLQREKVEFAYYEELCDQESNFNSFVDEDY